MTTLPFLFFIAFVGFLILDLVFEARGKKTSIFKFAAVFSIMCLTVTGLITSNISEPTETKVGTVTKYKNNVLVIDDVNAYHLFDTDTTVPALCKVLEPGDYVEITYTETTNYVEDCRVISKVDKDNISNQNQFEKDFAETENETNSEG